MSKKRKYKNKSVWILPGALGLILLIGTFVSIIQMRQTSTVRTKAQNILPTATPIDPPPALPTAIVSTIPTPTPSTPTLSITPTIGISVTPTPITIYPTLQSLVPNVAKPGEKVKVTGTGGYQKTWDGGFIEGSRYFQLYFDGDSIGAIQCYLQLCDGEFLVPQTTSGSHIVSTEGGSKLSLSVILLPIKTPTPTKTSSTLTPTTVPDFTPNPLNMQLFITAKIIGIGDGGNRNPKHFTRPVIVGIYDMKNRLVTEGNGFIVYDKINLFRGIIHFGPLENGTYAVKILSPHMLKSTVLPMFQILDSKKLNIMPQVTLMQGDFNEDNVIDIADYNLSLGCFQDKKCQDKDLIDFNDDSKANIIDYNILLHDFWQLQGD